MDLQWFLTNLDWLQKESQYKGKRDITGLDGKGAQLHSLKHTCGMSHF